MIATTAPLLHCTLFHLRFIGFVGSLLILLSTTLSPLNLALTHSGDLNENGVYLYLAVKTCENESE